MVKVISDIRNADVDRFDSILALPAVYFFQNRKKSLYPQVMRTKKFGWQWQVPYFIYLYFHLRGISAI
jgi:hypothetical protein